MRARCARGRRSVGGAERSLRCGECRAATSAKLILVHTRCAPGHLYVPNHFPAFRMYSISPHMLGYIQIPWVQDGLLPLSQSSPCVPCDPPSCSRPSSVTQLSRALHIELPRRSEASLSNLHTRSSNATSTPDIQDGDSYYIDITLGGQNFSAMIVMGRYALLYICLTSSVFGVIRLFISV